MIKPKALRRLLQNTLISVIYNVVYNNVNIRYYKYVIKFILVHIYWS